MKIHFYGTGASEGVPGFFCECEHCKEARRLGGKNLRTRTCAKLDEEILIDFSMDTYAQTLFRQLDMTKINYVLVTHSHDDHLYAPGLMQVKPPMAFYKRPRSLRVFGNEKVNKMIQYEMGKYGRNRAEIEEYLNVQVLSPFEEAAAGDYKIHALPANHDMDENCFIYVIARDGKTLLYGHDTAIFGEETWAELKKYCFDCVILDCTMVEETGIFKEHMGLPDNVVIRERMLREGMATANTKFVATHFTHIYNPAHQRITPIFAEKGFLAAYDGMEVEF